MSNKTLQRPNSWIPNNAKKIVHPETGKQLGLLTQTQRYIKNVTKTRNTEYRGIPLNLHILKNTVKPAANHIDILYHTENDTILLRTTPTHFLQNATKNKQKNTATLPLHKFSRAYSKNQDQHVKTYTLGKHGNQSTFNDYTAK